MLSKGRIGIKNKAAVVAFCTSVYESNKSQFNAYAFNVYSYFTHQIHCQTAYIDAKYTAIHEYETQGDERESRNAICNNKTHVK